jgi:hypothetical protein
MEGAVVKGAIFRILGVLLIGGLVGCNSSAVKDAIDLAQGIPRKDIDTSILGVNAFANDGRFGSPAAQFREVRDTLRLRYVRILFNWDDNVQPSPGSALNLSFYDDLVAALPSGIDALVVLTGAPGWMDDPANWRGGNPRATFVEEFIRPIATRYGGDGRIRGFQIWNEPNMVVNPDNITLGFATDPAAYVELLARANNVVRSVAPGKLIVSAATTAINQNYSETLDYNRGMRDAGAQEFIDVWAVHYYGRQFENVIRSGGVEEFLNGLARPIWVTESGAQGVNEQLGYGEQVWPFLVDRIANLERIYVYQFTESTPSDVTYGLRNLSGDFPVSDLYVFLRDR